MIQRIAIKKGTHEFYNGYEIYQAKNGYFFAISGNPQFYDIDGCETIEEIKDDIDAVIEAMS